jgi:APA family basic amino acid/polyamine antiporter
VFDLMTGYIIFSSSIFYMLAVAAVLVLRRRHPEWERPFRVHWLVPVAYLGFYTWFLGHVLLARPIESRIGIFMSLSGIPVLLAGIVYARWRPARGAASGSVTEPGDSSDE